MAAPARERVVDRACDLEFAPKSVAIARAAARPLGDLLLLLTYSWISELKL